MTNQEILTKAIQKAIDNGFKPTKFAWIPEDYQALLDWWLEGDKYKAVIFDHDFAKTLWDEQSDTLIVQNNSLNVKQVIDMNGWRYHLQQMVIAEDPIAYLGENI
jgi:hypothetical protein